MDLNGIRNRLARLAATVAVAHEEDSVSVKMYEGSLTRADALAQLWLEEKQDAARTGRAPDPQRALGFLRLFDSTTHVVMIKQGKWDHRRETAFAYDFRDWTREEFIAFEKVSAFGGRVTDAEAALLAGMGAKIATLEERAAAVWADDEERARFFEVN
jgi:hypothetical protein